MNYYHSNIALLEKREPMLYQRLLRVAPNRIPELASPSPLPPDLNLKKADVIAILGFGLGHHIKELIDMASPQAFILVIEPDMAVFKAALSEIDLSPFLEKRVSLAIGEDPLSATRIRIDTHYGFFTLSRIRFVEHYPSTQRTPDYFKKIKENLQEAAKMGLRNVATLNKFAPQWQKNILENLPTIIKSPGVNRFFGRFQDVPAIIVCAGPSLDKNVHHLKEAEGKALIVCVDTAIRTLLSHSITPDLIVSIDSQEKNYRHIKGVETKDPFLVIAPVTYPEVIKELSLPVFITDYGHPMVDWIESFVGAKGYTKVGGSVAHTCFDLLVQSGANPIVFVGQDLAYTDGKLHTDKVSYMDEWLESLDKFGTLETKIRERMREGGLALVEGQDGNKIMTSYQMSGWLSWFEIQIERTKAICINATEGGAKIKGCAQMSLKEAIGRFCKDGVKARKVLEKALDSYKAPSPELLVRGMKSLVQQWEETLGFSFQGKEMVNELIDLLKEGKAGSPRIRELFSKAEVFYKKIMGQKKIMQISRWSIEPLNAKIRYLLSKGNDKLHIAKTYKIFFSDMEEISKTTTEQLGQALRKTAAKP